jgi:hypothetical protein
MGTNLVPGLYQRMSNDDYHGHRESYSGSSLKDFSVYPLRLIYERANRTDKVAFDLGTAAHTAILEPDKWEDAVEICDDALLGKGGAKSTNAYKEWLSAVRAAGKTPLTQAEAARIRACRDAVHANMGHSQARKLLTGGVAEASAFWLEYFGTEPAAVDDSGYPALPLRFDAEDNHAMLMKCRPDYLPGGGMVVDLKTTDRLLTADGFERTANNLFYHWSAALTLRGMHKATGLPHNLYFFVVVEVNPPHEVAVFRADRDFLALGNAEVYPMLQRLAWCDYKRVWPGIPDRVQPVSAPGYKLRKINQDRGVE